MKYKGFKKILVTIYNIYNLFFHLWPFFFFIDHLKMMLSTLTARVQSSPLHRSFIL